MYTYVPRKMGVMCILFCICHWENVMMNFILILKNSLDFFTNLLYFDIALRKVK